MGTGTYPGLDPELARRLDLVEQAAEAEELNVRDIVAAAIVAGLIPLVLVLIAWFV
jgi:CHASE3 domain sensor protein